jgi:PKD repeat protein
MEIIDVEIDSLTTGTVGKSIKFKGSTTYEGSDLEWSWDFGDNDTSDLKEPSHTYAENGEYEVSLEVYDSTGLVYGFASTTVTISGGSSNGNGSNGSEDSGSGLIVFIVLIIIVVIVGVAVVFFIRRR